MQHLQTLLVADQSQILFTSLSRRAFSATDYDSFGSGQWTYVSTIAVFGLGQTERKHLESLSEIREEFLNEQVALYSGPFAPLSGYDRSRCSEPLLNIIFASRTSAPTILPGDLQRFPLHTQHIQFVHSFSTLVAGVPRC